MEQVDASGQKVTLVHFAFQVYPTRLSCMPNMTEFGLTPYHPVCMHTNAHQAVTCPACKASATYKGAGGK